MTARRQYYSERHGRAPDGWRLDLDRLKYLFATTYADLERQGLFQQLFGYTCVDAGEVAGNAGVDLDAFSFKHIRRLEVFPVKAHWDAYDEDTLFDVMELLFDHAAVGTGGTFHRHLDCGWHYTEFDELEGKHTVRLAFNDLLSDYKAGFELSATGEIVALAPEGLSELYAPLSSGCDPSAVQARTAAAIAKFRRRGASPDDWRDAVRDLFDVLEYLRPQAKARLTRADERDLFIMANEFSIRHHNTRQRPNYDRSIWLPGCSTTAWRRFMPSRS